MGIVTDALKLLVCENCLYSRVHQEGPNKRQCNCDKDGYMTRNAESVCAGGLWLVETEPTINGERRLSVSPETLEFALTQCLDGAVGPGRILPRSEWP